MANNSDSLHSSCVYYRVHHPLCQQKPDQHDPPILGYLGVSGTMTGSSSSGSGRQPRFRPPGLSGSDEQGLSANLSSMTSSSSGKQLVPESPEIQTHIKYLLNESKDQTLKLSQYTEQHRVLAQLAQKSRHLTAQQNHAKHGKSPQLHRCTETALKPRHLTRTPQRFAPFSCR